MTGIKCINSIYSTLNQHKLKQTVIEYTAMNGCTGTKIVTEIDGAGNKVIKDIRRGISGVPNKVVKIMNGKKEVYVPAYSDHRHGVYMYDEANKETYLPHVQFDSLCGY